MVVNGGSASLPLAGGNSAPERPNNEDGRRFKGDPRKLPMIKLSDLSDVHRRQVVTGLRELVQRTCPETVQHLVEKRKNIADVIDIVKQQTNLTYFNLSSTTTPTSGNEQVVTRSPNGDSRITQHAPGSKLNAGNQHASTAGTFVSPQSSSSNSKTAVACKAVPPKIAPPVLSVSTTTNLINRKHLHAENTSDGKHANDAADQNTDSALPPNTNNKPAKKRVKLDPNVFQAAADAAVQKQTETPPPLLFRAPPEPATSSSPTDLSLQQYSERGGISYTRLRTTSGNRSRRGGRSQQRWKSGTIVTHYLALSTQDLVDYPDRPPLTDQLVDAIRNESFMRVSYNSMISDDCSEDGAHATSNSPIAHATNSRMSMSPDDAGSNISFESSTLVERQRSSSPPVLQKVANPVDVQPEPLSPETAAALHADLPCDNVLLRIFERRYNLSLPDAASRLLANDGAAARDAAKSKFRYPPAILKYPEGSALVHCRSMRLVKEYFSGFNVGVVLGKCELCKQVGLNGLWSKSGRFCSSQCTKRFSRHCQTQQNRQQQEALERRRMAAAVAPSTTLSSNDVENVQASSKSRPAYSSPLKQSTEKAETKPSATYAAPLDQFHRNSTQKQPAPRSAEESESNTSKLPVAVAPAQKRGGPLPSSAASRRNEQQVSSAASATKTNASVVASAVTAQPAEASGPPPFPVDAVVLKSLEHKNAKEWTKEEVAQYISAFVFHISPDIPRQFISACVDGEALLMLNMEMLTSLMHIPLGHALKINYAIEELQKTQGKIDMKKLRIPLHQHKPTPR